MSLTKLQSNGIAAGAITVNAILDSSITSGKIADDSVTTAKIADANVTTAKIADDSVTTSKISANIVLRGTTTFLGASLEEANVISSNVTADVVVDNQIDSIVYYTENSTSNANVTVNFNNMDYISVGNVSSFVVILTNNADYQAVINDVQINGATGNTVRWQGGLPTSGDANLDVYSFSVIKIAASGYTVLAAKNNFD